MVAENLVSRRSFQSKRSTGLTLVEVLLALTIFSILLSAIFFIFRFGLSAWHKTTTKNELLQQSQILNVRLSRELQRSSLSSLSSNPVAGVVAFLSPLDSDGRFVLDTQGRPDWQEYVVYYLNKTEHVVYRRQVPLVAGAAERRVPTPIEDYNPGSGALALSAYANGGRPVARFVDEFEPTIFPAPISQLSWRLVLERQRYGSERPERLSTTVASFLRN